MFIASGDRCIPIRLNQSFLIIRSTLYNLQKFFKDKTVLIIAHQLYADQIVVLENGNIVEIGTHIELTNKRGKYFELVKNQLELGN
jgi:ATP-binding cassette subfamily B protein